MANPYSTPETRITNEDDRVIELLVRFKHQMKVVNMLRQDGMEFSDAQATVGLNVKAAQAALDKMYRAWKITGITFLMLAGIALALIVYFSLYLSFISIGVLCLFAAGSVTSFRRCEKIKF